MVHTWNRGQVAIGFEYVVIIHVVLLRKCMDNGYLGKNVLIDAGICIKA